MKKFITLILTLSIVFSTVFGLTSCFAPQEEKVAKLTLRFYNNGDRHAVIEIDLHNPQIPELPENPTKEGYIFDGWFFDDNTWEKPLTEEAIDDIFDKYKEQLLEDDEIDDVLKIYAKFIEDVPINPTPEPEPDRKSVV